jgi:hypothetical protein
MKARGSISAFVAALLVFSFQIDLRAGSLIMTVGNSSQVPSNTVDMGEEASKLSVSLKRQTPIETIGSKSQNLGDGMPDARISYQLHLHPWGIEKDLGSAPATIDDLISSVRDRISENAGRVPASSVDAILSKLEEMKSHGRVAYGEISSKMLGLYYKMCGAAPGKKAGTIDIHPHLAVIAMKVGRPLVACILFHEAGHASDPNICSESVEDVESYAFHREYDCIKAVYPTLQRIATTSKILDNQAKMSSSPVIEESRRFMTNIYKIYQTNGDDAKIRTLVQKLYNADGTPNSSGA